MLETYKATLRGDRIEWEAETPNALRDGKSVEVFVTVLDESNDAKQRPFGLGKGDFVAPEDFDAALPDDVLASFER